MPHTPHGAVCGFTAQLPLAAFQMIWWILAQDILLQHDGLVFQRKEVKIYCLNITLPLSDRGSLHLRLLRSWRQVLEDSLELMVQLST